MKLALLAVTTFFVAVACAKMMPGGGLRAVEAAVREKFPSVPLVSTDELAREMADERTILLLDVRTPEEFAVSRLRGARRIDPDAEPGEIPFLPEDADIVTYCSVGYRSAKMAARLRAAGYLHVRNLEGSIFRWANEGRPLYRGNQLARKVHPYNAVWGRLLDPWRRAEVSANE